MKMTEAEYQSLMASRPVRQRKPAEVVAIPRPVEKRRGRMNKTEALYAQQVLDIRKHAGEIVQYWFESIKLRLATGAWFTVDFVAITPQGTLEFHEVKGHWRTAARVRIKVAAEAYPFKFISVQKVLEKHGGGWKVEQF